MAAYGFIRDLRAEVSVPADGILSRTVHSDDRTTLTVFGFDAGQELTEHTSSSAAIVEFLEGTGEIVLDGETHEVGPGSWVAMPPGMRHAIRARTPLTMSLVLLRSTPG
jgi:quercetin dioxygenase-like cupin family protein